MRLKDRLKDIIDNIPQSDWIGASIVWLVINFIFFWVGFAINNIFQVMLFSLIVSSSMMTLFLILEGRNNFKDREE